MNWRKCKSCGVWCERRDSSRYCERCRKDGETWRTLHAARTRKPKWWR